MLQNYHWVRELSYVLDLRGAYYTHSRSGGIYNSWGPTNHFKKIFKKSFRNKFPRKKVQTFITNLRQFRC